MTCEPLQALLTLAKTAPAEELPRLLGDLEEIRVTAMARLTAPASLPQRDELIDVATAAQRLASRKITSTAITSNIRSPVARGGNCSFPALGIDDHIREKGNKDVLTARQRERILGLSSSR